MKWIDSERILKKAGIKIFSQLELERILHASAIAVRFFTYRNAQKGYLKRLKKGLYCLSDFPPSELEVANKLYAPSYVSFEYALSYYNIIPEAVYAVTSATTKPTREFKSMGLSFMYHTLQREFFQGYHPEKIQNTLVLISDPEKAVIDYLYLQSLHKKPSLDRFSLKGCSKSKLMRYACLFHKSKLMGLLKELL